jgi:hypothetical protein
MERVMDLSGGYDDDDGRQFTNLIASSSASTRVKLCSTIELLTLNGPGRQRFHTCSLEMQPTAPAAKSTRKEVRA